MASPTPTPEPSDGGTARERGVASAARRIVFFDVENSSRADHVSEVLEQLGLDMSDGTTRLVAVGNWRVVAEETARLLSRRGALLVHSAPAFGVKDWSDLRIAVAVGVWLGTARAGDRVEVVTDDQAFDAVGDLAATLGVAFRRISHRRLVRDGLVSRTAPPARRRRRQSSRSGRPRPAARRPRA